ncbi:MAG: ADP-ribosylglycohydrolase family protein [Anaerolineae bacterium]
MANLFDKIYGCIAASRIGSSMGTLTEGWSVERITQVYGRVTDLADKPARHREPVRRRAQPWSERYFWHYPEDRKAGETEDGIERQKLIAQAIIEKRGRITATDLAAVIARDVDEKRDFGYRMWVGDALLYPFVKAGVPANYVGMFSPWPGIVSFTRACHPIGLVNACNPEAAARDAWEVGMLYQPTWSTGLPTAAAFAAGLAEACKADATRDSVVSVVRQYCGEAVRTEIDACMAVALKHNDPYAMRDEMNARYAGIPGDFGEELLAKGLAIFYVTAGNVKETILGGVNFGRDTDCVTAIAAGFSGALSGTATIPAEWIQTVDRAEKDAVHTVSHLSCRETAEGLYAAALNEMSMARQHIAALEASIAAP